ncbi:MAG: extracellular solute-binding protein [Clostridia bacterium]
MKKIISICLACLLLFSFVACNAEEDMDLESDLISTSEDEQNDEETLVYLYASRNELEDVYMAIAERYEAETGIKVKVVGGNGETYMDDLTDELKNEEVPTIYEVDGYSSLDTLKDSALELSTTDLYSYLSSSDLALSMGGEVYGIPLDLEAYGIIYNEEIFDRYFALENRQTEVNTVDEINSYDKLKIVAEDMQNFTEELEISGVFAATSFDEGDTSWTDHLSGISMYLEFGDSEDFDDYNSASMGSDEIEFSYGDNFKNFFDLYSSNSTATETSSDTASISTAYSDFALGEAAMMLGDSKAWEEINSIDGNVVSEDKLKMMPIYMGAQDEENWGLSVGSESYFVINSKASEEAQTASIEFLEWLITSEEGKRFMSEELEFTAAFSSFDEDERIDDPLSSEIYRHLEKENVTSIPWTHTTFTDEFKTNFNSSLSEYSSGSLMWDDFVDRIKTAWSDAKNALTDGADDLMEDASDGADDLMDEETESSDTGEEGIDTTSNDSQDSSTSADENADTLIE